MTALAGAALGKLAMDLLWLLLARLVACLSEMITWVVFLICSILTTALGTLTPGVVQSLLAIMGEGFAGGAGINEMIIIVARLLAVTMFVFAGLNIITAPMTGEKSTMSPAVLGLRLAAAFVGIQIIQDAASIVWELFAKLHQTMMVSSGDSLTYFGAGDVADTLSSITTTPDLGLDVALGELVGPLVGLLIMAIVYWNFLTLILELAQRYAITIIYVLLSPLAAATIVSPSASDAMKKWLRVFFNECVLMTLNGWCVVVGASAVRLVTSSGGAATGVEFVGRALLAYGVLKALQQLDDIFKSVGADVVKQTGSLFGDLGSMMAAAKGITSLHKGVSSIGNSPLAQKGRQVMSENVASGAQALGINPAGTPNGALQRFAKGFADGAGKSAFIGTVAAGVGAGSTAMDNFKQAQQLKADGARASAFKTGVGTQVSSLQGALKSKAGAMNAVNSVNSAMQQLSEKSVRVQMAQTAAAAAQANYNAAAEHKTAAEGRLEAAKNNMNQVTSNIGVDPNHDITNLTGAEREKAIHGVRNELQDAANEAQKGMNDEAKMAANVLDSTNSFEEMAEARARAQQTLSDAAGGNADIRDAQSTQQLSSAIANREKQLTGNVTAAENALKESTATSRKLAARTRDLKSAGEAVERAQGGLSATAGESAAKTIMEAQSASERSAAISSVREQMQERINTSTGTERAAAEKALSDFNTAAGTYTKAVNDERAIAQSITDIGGLSGEDANSFVNGTAESRNSKINEMRVASAAQESRAEQELASAKVNLQEFTDAKASYMEAEKNYESALSGVGESANKIGYQMDTSPASFSEIDSRVEKKQSAAIEHLNNNGGAGYEVAASNLAQFDSAVNKLRAAEYNYASADSHERAANRTLTEALNEQVQAKAEYDSAQGDLRGAYDRAYGYAQEAQLYANGESPETVEKFMTMKDHQGAYQAAQAQVEQASAEFEKVKASGAQENSAEYMSAKSAYDHAQETFTAEQKIRDDFAQSTTSGKGLCEVAQQAETQKQSLEGTGGRAYENAKATYENAQKRYEAYRDAVCSPSAQSKQEYAQQIESAIQEANQFGESYAKQHTSYDRAQVAEMYAQSAGVQQVLTSSDALFAPAISNLSEHCDAMQANIGAQMDNLEKQGLLESSALRDSMMYDINNKFMEGTVRFDSDMQVPYQNAKLDSVYSNANGTLNTTYSGVSEDGKTKYIGKTAGTYYEPAANNSTNLTHSSNIAAIIRSDDSRDGVCTAQVISTAANGESKTSRFHVISENRTDSTGMPVHTVMNEDDGSRLTVGYSGTAEELAEMLTGASAETPNFGNLGFVKVVERGSAANGGAGTSWAVNVAQNIETQRKASADARQQASGNGRGRQKGSYWGKKNTHSEKQAHHGHNR